MTRTMILLAFVCLVLTITLPTLAQQPDSTTPTDTLHPKILEERIKALEKEIAKVDAERKRELDQRVEASEKRMDQYVWGIGVVAAAVVVILTFFGFPAIQKYIQARIDSEVDCKVAGLEEAIREKGERAVDVLVESAKRRLAAADTAQSEYEQLRDQLTELARVKKKEVPLTEEMKQKLDDFERKLSSLKPESMYSAEEWHLSGYNAQRRGQHDAAIQLFTRAIEFEPDNPKYFYDRGISYCRVRKYEESLEDYNRVIDLDPGFIGTYLNAAEVALMLGLTDEALRRVDESLGLSKTPVDRAVSLFLKCIVEKQLSHNTTSSEKEFEDSLRVTFTHSWSFEDMEGWLTTADIAVDVRKFIQEKTELLKAKLKKKG